MKKRIFLEKQENLREALSYASPSFEKLSYVIKNTFKIKVEFNAELDQFCDETLVLRHPSSTWYCEGPRKFQDVMNENVRELLESHNHNYVQCFGHIIKDHGLAYKNLNFGKTIAQTSKLEQLSEVLGLNILKQLIYDYTILMKYEGDYFQVTGPPLSDQFGYQITGDKSKKKFFKKDPNKKLDMIQRFQMLYCSHTNRNSGLFHKNIFYSYCTQNSQYKEEKVLNETTGMILGSMKFQKEQIKMLKNQMKKVLSNIGSIFKVKKRKNNKTSSTFDFFLTEHCPLPEDYQQIKHMVLKYIQEGSQGKGEQLFEKLYKNAIQYRDIFYMLRNVMERIQLWRLLGRENTALFIYQLRHFVEMKRYENYKTEELVKQMDIFQIPWAKIKFNKKYKGLIIARGRNILSGILILFYNQLIIPLLKHNFYITEKHRQANKLFYYRKPLWILIQKLALKNFGDENLRSISQAQYNEIKANGQNYPEGKLRIMPKKGTFRPIITFNRKRKVEGENYRATLNQILGDTQLVLRNLKNTLGLQGRGYCIFDNKQISKKYDKFVESWRENGSPPLVYFTLDIKKCYDSIDTGKLIQIIENTPYIENMYMIVKYLRLYRNKKPFKNKGKLTEYFNFKERIHATSLSNDPIKIYEQNKTAINIFTAKQKLITREDIITRLKQLCDGSIVSYKKHIFQQKVGIPQGLNVSGVLCSLYFSNLQNQYVNIQKGLLMRLTDDYMYIGPEDEANQVLNGLLKCAEENKFIFNQEKINKNFVHPEIKKITTSEQFIWIGKKININTLQMFPSYELSQEKLAYAMNVNINRKHVHSFLKNKLKSLLTNHFSSYFKPYLYGFQSLKKTIQIYCRMSLSKFFPFLVEFHKLKYPDENEVIIKMLSATTHEFLIYLCWFLPQGRENYQYYIFLKIILEEFSQFFKKKRSYQNFRPLQTIFIARYRAVCSILKKNQMVQ